MTYIIDYKAIGSRMLSDGRTSLLRAFKYLSGRQRYLQYLMGAETLYGRGPLAPYTEETFED